MLLLNQHFHPLTIVESMDTKTLLSIWKEKNIAVNARYSDEQLSEIAVNCISLSNAWLSKAKKGMSFKLVLVHTEMTDDAALDGVTQETLPIELFSILTDKNGMYRSVSLIEYSVNDSKEISSETLGTLDIS